MRQFQLFSLHTAPSSPPLYPTAKAENSTAILLSWSPPPAIDVNGVLRHYVVELTETETGRVWSDLVATGTVLTVTALHPHYLYSARIAAYTTGPGPYTQAVHVQTNESGE